MSTQAKEIYDQMTGQKSAYLLAVTVALLIYFSVDIMTGPSWLSIDKVFGAILHPGSSDAATDAIVWIIRLPVALMALGVGAALGVAGAEMQTILDNPLADPYILGISAAAGFGAALALVLGVGVTPFAEDILVPANAFVFSLLSCVTIYFIAKKKKDQKETIVLAGIALLFLFYSLLALLQYMATEDQLQSVVFWLFGSLMRATWPKLTVAFCVLLIVVPLLAKDAWKLTALRLGDDRATSLGIDVSRLRLNVLVYVSLLTATAVCFVGTIGFVGLVAPHKPGCLWGEDQRYIFAPVCLGRCPFALCCFNRL